MPGDIQPHKAEPKVPHRHALRGRIVAFNKQHDSLSQPSQASSGIWRSPVNGSMSLHAICPTGASLRTQCISSNEFFGSGGQLGCMRGDESEAALEDVCLAGPPSCTWGVGVVSRRCPC